MHAAFTTDNQCLESEWPFLIFEMPVQLDLIKNIFLYTFPIHESERALNHVPKLIKI